MSLRTEVDLVIVPEQRDDTASKKESVWDYPLPTRLELTHGLLRVEFSGELIAQTRLSYRVLESNTVASCPLSCRTDRSACHQQSSENCLDLSSHILNPGFVWQVPSYQMNLQPKND